MLTSRKVRMRTEGTKRAGRYMSQTQASLSVDLDAGRRGVRPHGHVDTVGQVETPLGLHHVGEEGQDGPILLDQCQLDLRLVPLEILFAHRHRRSASLGARRRTAGHRRTRRRLRSGQTAAP